MHIIHFGLTPGGGTGRDGLPAGVDTWLMPVQQAIWKVQREAAR